MSRHGKGIIVMMRRKKKKLGFWSWRIASSMMRVKVLHLQQRLAQRHMLTGSRPQKKASSKLIKSVIDIDDDGSSRSRIHHQENPNLLVDIKTVRVKKVVRKTSVTKEAPVCIKKEKEVESPGLPNLVAKLPDSGNQQRKEDLRNLTTVTLSMKKIEAIRL